MRSLLTAAVTGLFLVAACGSDSSSVTGPDAGSGGSGGSTATGGSLGTGAAWPTGGGAGAPSGGQAGAAGSAGTSGTSGASGAGGSGAGGTAGSSCGVTGTIQCGTGGPCSFPQGVPDGDFISAACTFQDTDKSVDDAVNAVMATLSGCGVGSDCPITTVGGANTNEICQNWFAAVAQSLRGQGYCAGQHAVGSTDEIAVSNTCCEGKWYGYHICNYGGAKVVWNPGARRGWWMVKPSYCSP